MATLITDKQSEAVDKFRVDIETLFAIRETAHQGHLPCSRELSKPENSNGNHIQIKLWKENMSVSSFRRLKKYMISSKLWKENMEREHECLIVSTFKKGYHFFES